MHAGLSQIVVDCREPRQLARFWAALLGGEVVDRPHGWSYLTPPGFPRLGFQPVPEPKTAKNRLHMDIEVDEIEAATARALALGAERIGGVVTDEAGSFQVMRDPEGNEFCFVHD